MSVLLQGYIPLPKSSSKRRIESNVNVYDFELSSDEIAHLDSLNEGMDALLFEITAWKHLSTGFLDLVTDWDPTKCP